MAESKFTMNVAVRKVPKDENMFEFTITTPTLRTQFLLPRALVNQLRGLIEKALVSGD